MPLREVYTTSPPVLVNFDFEDILSDAGYITLTAMIDEAANERLIRQALDGVILRTVVTGNSGETVEKNFDFEFNISQLVKGDLFVSITIFADGSGSNTGINNTTIEIFHVDSGAAETTIGTQQSIAELTNPVSTAQDEYRSTLTFAVNKRFKKGDKLRIEVISTVTGGNPNGKAGFYHDSADRDTGLTDQNNFTAKSNLLVQVPFDLDI